MKIEEKNIEMFSGAADYLSQSRRPLDGGIADKIRQALRGATVSSFLDLGCGIGFLAETLKSLFPGARGRGIDASAELINLARNNASEGNHYEVGNAYHLDVADGTYDLTACQTLLIHLAHPDRAVEEMVRVTRPTGRLLIIEPIIHESGTVGFVPGEGAAKKNLRDELLRFDIATKRAGGVDMCVAAKVPHLLLEAGATNISVDSYNIVTYSEENRSSAGSSIEYRSYDHFMLDLGYDKDKLDRLKQAENAFQRVKGELNVVTLLIVCAAVTGNSASDDLL